MNSTSCYFISNHFPAKGIALPHQKPLGAPPGLVGEPSASTTKVSSKVVGGKSSVEVLVGLGLLLASTSMLGGNFGNWVANNLNGRDVSGKGTSRVCLENPKIIADADCTKEGGCYFGATLDFCTLKNLLLSLKGEIERCIERLESSLGPLGL